MKQLKVIEFSEFPGPRYIHLGDSSGEQFREKYLLPKIKEHGVIQVDLDGAFGYGSSFLEEAFGGLLRAGVEPEIARGIAQNLKSDDDPSLKIEVTGYIEDAINENSNEQ